MISMNSCLDRSTVLDSPSMRNQSIIELSRSSDSLSLPFEAPKKSGSARKMAKIIRILQSESK